MYSVNQAVYGNTLKKNSILYNASTVITGSNVLARLDYSSTNSVQRYTFGNAIPNLWVAGGKSVQGTNSGFLIYSYDGINWNSNSSTFSFGEECYTVEWNGFMWVAGGGPINGGTYTRTLAYSYDGINWSPAGFSFTKSCNTVSWNGTMWLAGGSSNSNYGTTPNLAYSYDGVNWTGINSTLLTSECNVIANNGTLWVAYGTPSSGSINMQYSSDGINWSATTYNNYSNTTVINSIVWNGVIWVAGGQQSTGSSVDILAYSFDGINWTGSTQTAIVNTVTYIGWNGTIWLAFCDINKMAYSYDGVTWLLSGTSVPFSGGATSLTWNGTMWLLSGTGSATVIAYSYNGLGLHWYSSTTTNVDPIVITINAIAFNSKRPCTITFPQGYTGYGVVNIIGSTGVTGGTSITVDNPPQLDIVSDSYYNTGFTNMTFTITP